MGESKNSNNRRIVNGKTLMLEQLIYYFLIYSDYLALMFITTMYRSFSKHNDET